MADGLALSATAGLQVMARRCGLRTPLSPGVLLLNLLITGYLDNTVKPRNSARLAELVTAASGQAQLVIVPDRERANSFSHAQRHG